MIHETEPAESRHSPPAPDAAHLTLATLGLMRDAGVPLQTDDAPAQPGNDGLCARRRAHLGQDLADMVLGGMRRNAEDRQEPSSLATPQSA